MTDRLLKCIHIRYFVWHNVFDCPYNVRPELQAVQALWRVNFTVLAMYHMYYSPLIKSENTGL